MTGPLLHLISTAGWRTALARGALAPTPGAGFVHLSTPDQVVLPANGLFAGRRDVVLLAVDPDGLDVRFEPGLPDDPPGMRFPHAYGPVPTSAVVAALPYRPGPDGRFPPPPDPPTRTDTPTRTGALEPSLLRRIATDEAPVTGGVAVLTAAFPASHQHNQLLLGDADDAVFDAASVTADGDRVLGGAGLAHRAARLAGPRAAATAAALRDDGWTARRVVTLCAPARPGPVEPVELVDLETLRPSVTATWHRDAPRATSEQVAQLVDRHRAQEDVTDLRYLAVRAAGDVVASALFSIDGATALLDAVETAPGHRGSGHGDALVRAALALAARAGCDLVCLDALADDWPRLWYARRGFVEVGELWAVDRR